MNRIIYILLLVISMYGCNEESAIQETYMDQIGDTSFIAELDNPNFKFCDSVNVLHKRALVKYSAGKKALNNDLIERFNSEDKYDDVNGYIVVRFAVNCNNQVGRIRYEYLDTNFNLVDYPERLKQHIDSIFKSLDNWKHAIYQGKTYDCYTFRTIKLTNGNIEIL